MRVTSSQNMPSMHHLISWLYIILSRLISFAVCCLVCQDNTSPLKWNLWDKIKGEWGKRCVTDEQRELPGRQSVKNHSIFVWDWVLFSSAWSVRTLYYSLTIATMFFGQPRYKCQHKQLIKNKIECYRQLVVFLYPKLNHRVATKNIVITF